MKYDAIIFDCDGVLIDSEVLAFQVAVELYRKAGYDTDLMTCIRKFAGMSIPQTNVAILKETGVDYGAQIDWDQAELERQRLFEEGLQATSGIVDVLQELEKKRIPIAVASGSSPQRLRQSLTKTGLWGFFQSHVYSAEQVENGKPAPDVYLFAADALGVEPEKCLAVEDGVHGTHAGLAAGMDVFGYYGASHGSVEWAQSLKEAGCCVLFDDMRQLPQLLA